MKSYRCTCLLLLPSLAASLTLRCDKRNKIANNRSYRIRPTFTSLVSHMNEEDAVVTDQEHFLDPTISSQFKILTCSATSCSKRSEALGLDEYALFSGLYVRKENANAPEIEVEESSCLGSCKAGPCVGIEHSDYVGTVALEGMKPNEFHNRVFQNVETEEDLDRIWSCIENSVRVMAEEGDDV
mmetsp:Transcript_22642/g.27774  ORF Transcript_22642/g.27774 Transcript_22642/m.27774 type:complete len:184 (+) Transcript_22642:85-636(+)